MWKRVSASVCESAGDEGWGWGVEVVVVMMVVGWGGIKRDVGTASLNVSHSYKKQQAHIQKGVQLCFSRVVKAVGGACHSGA